MWDTITVMKKDYLVQMSENNSGGYFRIQPAHVEKLRENGWKCVQRTFGSGGWELEKTFQGETSYVAADSAELEFYDITQLSRSYCECCGKAFDFEAFDMKME